MWVIAYGPNGIHSEWASEQFEIQVNPKPLLVVGGPGFEAGTTGYIIEWTFPATADHYDLWISNSRRVVKVRDMNVPATSYTLTGLFEKDMYLVWVRAAYADGTWSPWSTPESFQVN